MSNKKSEKMCNKKSEKSKNSSNNEFLKLPSMMNSEKKYKQCIKQLDTLDKFTAFMEDTLIVNTLHLNDQELWGLIQKISKDVTEQNPVSIPSISVHQWMVDYFNSWENMKIKDIPGGSESSSNTSTTSSSSISNSSETEESSEYSEDSSVYSDDTVLLNSEISEVESYSSSSEDENLSESYSDTD